jgi:hypothetical protein
MRYARRKRQRKESLLLLKEVREERLLEKVRKNWKSRRRKPRDKEVLVEVVSLHVKEMNRKKERIK